MQVFGESSDTAKDPPAHCARAAGAAHSSTSTAAHRVIPRAGPIIGCSTQRLSATPGYPYTICEKTSERGVHACMHHPRHPRHPRCTEVVADIAANSSTSTLARRVVALAESTIVWRFG
jgi:hypothetical protein